MSVSSWIGLTSDPQQDAANKAADQKVAAGRSAAIGLENYRQNARDEYHNLLTQRMAPYQAYSNRLAALTGTGMSTAGLAANDNPLSLRDTGVGAPVGSNYAGWDEAVHPHRPGESPNNLPVIVHHTGIGEYLNGTNQPDGLGHVPVYDSDGNRIPAAAGGGANTYVTADPMHVAQSQDPSLISTYQPGSMSLASGGGQQGPGYNFMPRRAP